MSRRGAVRRHLPLLLTLLLAAGLLLAAAPVDAHANYVRSEPASGARLGEAPTEVVVELSEHVDRRLSGLEVRDGDGERVDRGEPRFKRQGEHSFIAIDVEPLPDGVYLATWRAVSTVDTHETSGSWGFAIGAYTPPSVEAEVESWEAGSALWRAVLYVGFAASIGGLVFLFWLDPRGALVDGERWLVLAVLAGGALQAIAVTAIALITWPLGIAFTEFLRLTEVGQGYLVRIVASAILVGTVASWRTRPVTLGPIAYVAFAAQLVAVYGSAAVGHASQKGTLPVLFDLVHALAAAAWLGGLAILAIYLHLLTRKHRLGTAKRLGRRFGRMALGAVALLFATGIVLTLTIRGTALLADPALLLSTRWGLLLAIKVGLFALMLVFAAANRYLFLDRPVEDPGDASVTKGATDRGHPTPLRLLWQKVDFGWFRRTVADEAVLGVAVLVLAGFLTALSPAGLGSADDGPPAFEVARDTETFNVTLRLTPAPTAGTATNVTVLIWERETTEPLTEAIRVLVRIERTDRGDEPDLGGETFEARHVGDGIWAADDVTHVFAGDHVATVTIQTPYVYREQSHHPYTVAA